MPATSSDRRAAIVGGVGVVAFVAGAALGPVEETDLFFHLARGHEILSTGSVPTRNLFSFTYPDHPYPDPAWLFDVAAASLERAAGLPAIVVAKTALLVATFALAMALARKRGAGALAIAATFAAVTLVMRERFVERPHVLSFAGEIAVLFAIDARSRRAWWIVPVTALWANLHAGVFVAPLSLAAAAIGAWKDRSPDARRLAGMSLASAVATLATPVGIGIVRYLAFHVGIAAVHPIDEFRTPELRWDAPLLAFAGVTAIALLPWGRAGRAPWRDVLPVLCFGVLAARSVRFGADFALVAAPLVAARASVLTQGCGFRFTARMAVAIGCALMIAVVVPRVRAARAFSLGLAPDALPLDAIAFVDRNGLRDRLYNDLELGGYLAWQGWPRHRVFVDPRLPAYPDELHRLLGRADWSRAEWDGALARYGVDAALLGSAGVNRRVAWFDPERWALVYRAGDARVFVRRDDAHRGLIAHHEIPATFTFSEATGVATLPLGEPPASSPVARCEWRLRLGDLAFDLDGGVPTNALLRYREALADDPACGSPARAAAAHAWVGATLLQAGAAADALGHLERALASEGDVPSSTRTNRALALEVLGRKADAADAWQDVAAHATDPTLAEAALRRARKLR